MFNNTDFLFNNKLNLFKQHGAKRKTQLNELRTTTAPYTVFCKTTKTSSRYSKNIVRQNRIIPKTLIRNKFEGFFRLFN